VGSGVKAEINRLTDDGLLPEGVSFASWNASVAVLHPDRRVEPDDRETPLNAHSGDDDHAFQCMATT
jgi:phage terminase large subunit